jgi:hypothetical protein
MRIVAEIARDADEGPLGIDLAPGRDVALPDGPFESLGTVFRVDARTAQL